ncbi:hypothetical protein MSIMFI_03153 [Mycobacterium simulans]|nr:hypothetical protein [Mycobacterium simulans]SON61637.1 hypothetical protein MSIMFI_03153 [Mycobacterium simulans]
MNDMISSGEGASAARGPADDGDSVETPPAQNGESVATVTDDDGAGRAARLKTRWLGAIAAAVVLAVAGLGFGGWVLFQEHQRNEAAEEALAAARNYIVKLTNVDSDAVDAKSGDILDGSTGEFKDSYGKSRQQLRQMLVDNQVHTRGSIVEAAVKSATPNKVVVLMFVDESISNRNSPRSQIDHSRIKLTMVKRDGRWVARKVQLV